MDVNEMKRVWMLGDYLVDEFRLGRLVEHPESNRFHCDQVLIRDGGGGNCAANLAQLLLGDPKTYMSYTHSPEVFENMPILTRFIEKDTRKQILEAWNIPDANKVLHYSGGGQFWECPHVKDGEILVISDYNRGMCNHVQDDELLEIEFETIVFDSRYRTVAPELLKLGKTVIWRCTGEEWDEAWAKTVGVDWVIHTNGPKAIQIRDMSGTQWEVTVPVPPTTGKVYPVGCGDTMTAAIAACLSQHNEVNMANLMTATKFGVRCCQDVLQKELTAVTELTLEDYKI